MLRSLAIWCEPSEAERPSVELHFNIWQDLQPPASDGFDVGILFKGGISGLSRVNFFVPAPVEKDHLQDLAEVLHDQETLSAVFNDTLVPTEWAADNSFQASSASLQFTVAKIDVAKDLTLTSIEEEGERVGTVISIQAPVLQRLQKGQDGYIRLRIKLVDDLKRLFHSRIDPADGVFLSTFYRSEIVEFRVNEKRSFSQGLRHIHPKMLMPCVIMLQYFLIRSTDVELVRAHADFRKMRRLEPHLWRSYLATLGDNKTSPDNMIIYHWRPDPKNGEVEDYVALAFFRKPRANLIAYVLLIIFLGGVANAFQAVLASVLKGLGVGTSDLSIQANSIVVLLLLTICLGVAHRRWPRRFESFERLVSRGLRAVGPRDTKY